jgi:hypothetical protein
MIETMTLKPLKKDWGLNFSIFNNHNFEVHHACVEPGGYSSSHCHRHKYNLFYVVSGSLWVHFYGSEEGAANNQVAHTVELLVGDKLIVPPRIWHRFSAPKSSEPVNLLEVYWSDSVNPDDIVRKDVGGVYPN